MTVAASLAASVPPAAPHFDEFDVLTRFSQARPPAAATCHWVEVTQTGGGRTVLAAGTVFEAADVPGATLRLRTAVRAYARLGLSPAEALGHLDALLAELPEQTRSTCAYLVCDALHHSVTYSSAAHPTAVLGAPEGTVTPVEVRHGDPLGAGGARFAEALVPVSPGSALAVWAGGVRGDDPHADRASAELAAVVAAGAPDLDGFADRVWSTLLRQLGAGDDGALLAVVTPRATDIGRTGVWMTELSLAEGAEPTRRARAFCFGVLSTWQLPDAVRDDIVLAVSELVANALLHSGGAEQLRLRRTPRRVMVEVFDREPSMPRPRVADEDAESGRGLDLVRRVATRWGARPVGGGKSVWCEFELPEPPADVQTAFD